MGRLVSGWAGSESPSPTSAFKPGLGSGVSDCCLCWVRVSCSFFAWEGLLAVFA